MLTTLDDAAMSLRAWFLHFPTLWLHIGACWRNRMQIDSHQRPCVHHFSQ
jgi:hypothetical protein